MLSLSPILYTALDSSGDTIFRPPELEKASLVRLSKIAKVGSHYYINVPLS